PVHAHLTDRPAVLARREPGARRVARRYRVVLARLRIRLADYRHAAVFLARRPTAAGLVDVARAIPFAHRERLGVGASLGPGLAQHRHASPTQTNVFRVAGRIAGVYLREPGARRIAQHDFVGP